jgi:hypothetical protein
MTRARISAWVLVSSLLASFSGAAWPEQTVPSEDQPKNKKTAWLHEVYLKEASAYQFFLDDRNREELVLRREPVMRWTSDADYNGEVYVWTHRGAAAIVGCIFSGPQGPDARQIFHEFHSLASNPLHARERGGTGWLSQEAGIEPKPLPDAPEPARTPALRLTQMRDFARHFTSQVQRENA